MVLFKPFYFSSSDLLLYLPARGPDPQRTASPQKKQVKKLKKEPQMSGSLTLKRKFSEREKIVVLSVDYDNHGGALVFNKKMGFVQKLKTTFRSRYVERSM